MTAELRRSLFLAGVGLLCGFALVIAVFGTGELFKHGFGGRDASVPVAALPQGPDAKTPETRAPETRTPDSHSAESPASRSSPVTPPARQEEGASTTPGKPEGQGATGQGATGQAARSAPGELPAPTFDIIRVEPTGESVIAGRGAPNTTVELLRDNQPIARALVDPSGQFAIVPPALPAGSSEITLRSTGADGQGRQARESVAVVIAADRRAKPLVALTSPDKPTVVLSQPDPVTAAALAPKAGARPDLKPDTKTASKEGGPDARASTRQDGKPAASPQKAQADPARPGPAKPAADPSATVKIVSVDAEEGGRLYVTSQAPPGATVRLYLNDTLIAPGSVGADGRVAFTIGRGVAPGDYRIRIDQVDPVSGKVKTRSEVAFAMPGAAKPPALQLPGPVAVLSPPVKPPPAGSPPVQAVSPPEVRSPAAPQAASPKAEATPMTASPAPAGPTTNEAAFTAPVPPKVQPVPSKVQPVPQSVFVPEINTARITRGDSLWQISRRTYGKGTRYTVIFDANQPQIRNPDLIYPGQIFVLPSDGTAAVPQEQKRG